MNCNRKSVSVILVVISVAIYLSSCASKKEPKEKFVPYQAFVLNDVSALDSSALAVFAFTLDTAGKKIDSAIMDKKEFKEIAKQFITPNINEDKYFKHFTEKSYNDDITKTWNFTYSTKKEDLPIKSVIVTTSLEGNSNFKSLIVRKENAQKQLQQLIWEAGKYCMIITYDTSFNVVSTKRYNWGI